MKFENAEQTASFELPDKLTVRQQLGYRTRLYGGIRNDDYDTYVSMWTAVIPLFEKWECEFIPDPKALNLDTETDPRIADVVFWAGNRAAAHIQSAGQVQKN